MPSVQNNVTHPVLTARRALEYVFTPKHHGAFSEVACWLIALTLDEEFSIFNRADGIIAQNAAQDDRQVADLTGNLYGYERLPNGSFREIGTWYQQIAEFPVQLVGAAWHGYPIWPIKSPLAPPNLQGQQCRPAKEVFDRMEQLGDISHQQRKRLGKGDWI